MLWLQTATTGENRKPYARFKNHLILGVRAEEQQPTNHSSGTENIKANCTLLQSEVGILAPTSAEPFIHESNKQKTDSLSCFPFTFLGNGRSGNSIGWRVGMKLCLQFLPMLKKIKELLFCKLIFWLQMICSFRIINWDCSKKRILCCSNSERTPLSCITN